MKNEDKILNVKRKKKWKMWTKNVTYGQNMDKNVKYGQKMYHVKCGQKLKK